MKPWKTLATATADGQPLVLSERDGVFVIRIAGKELMSSLDHRSEDALAAAGVEGLKGGAPRVLIGGLGLGFTVRAALDRLPKAARVVVVELSDAVVEWNRGPLKALSGGALDDPRVCVELAEISRYVVKTSQRFEAVLLDVDNGPQALSRPGNQQLYGSAGLSAFHQVLAPGGLLVVWSAGPDQRFVDKLHLAGFDTQVIRSGKHTLFLARKRIAKGRATE